jgi:hypothetical protein
MTSFTLRVFSRWSRWPPVASAFVVSFQTLEGEGGHGVEGEKGHMIELLKECVK